MFCELLSGTHISVVAECRLVVRPVKALEHLWDRQRDE